MKKNTHRITVRFVFMMWGGGASLNAKFLAILSVCQVQRIGITFVREGVL